MWTALNQNKGYMTITAYFIDNNWNLQSQLMRFMYVPAPHTAEVLVEIIIEHFFEWNLDRKDGMSIIHDSIEKIRDSVSFWVGTPKREEKFIKAYEQLEIPYSKKLRMDCRTRWNSTYLMLVSALPYLEVFKRLTQREPQYKSLPSDDDWKMATEICEKLEIFYEVIELFSGMTDSMIPKFEKYWGMINGVMAIWVILDPRLKMKLLNYFFPLMYGSESTNQLNKVTKLLEDLVSEYQSREKRTTSISTSSSIVFGLDNNGGKVDWSSDFLKYVQETSSGDCVKFELDLYLEEPVLFNKSNISNFDILGYWKNIEVKYPTLQRIAKDFLAIPISTVASESAFSIGGQFLTPHRSKLNEDTVEALISNDESYESSDTKDLDVYFEQLINQAEEGENEDWGLPPNLRRMLEQEEREVKLHQEETGVLKLGIGREKKEVKVGTCMSAKVRDELVTLLRDY
ncbi:zinc finger BED domain-containing protein RICESLEEPER 2-like [Glycine max]|uniref:zinc finger BED domain-containing protein RICESLEEPER 2-like n=1 Tax=Glycine max TaxID=3847 RepID=UPI0007191DA8|nr:zinc finger BED domain-containing protein RICESLEEPER 2-like [Glycine max]|eukprot:XP_014626061.1 zinc finger BED domain-containing protein RICESLEEPER 2-like [Glycine max]